MIGVARSVSSRPRLRVDPPFRLKRMKPVAYGPRTSLTIASWVTLRYTVPSSPNPALKPEFAKSWELGAEVSFLNNRGRLDRTVSRKVNRVAVVNAARGPSAAGLMLLQ